MRDQSDVFKVLAWGLRSYAWVVVLFVVALGVVVPTLLQGTPERFEATAQAGPTGRVRLPNLDALPKVGTSAFANVYLSPEVKQAAGLSPSDQVGTDHVELVAGQDNVVFTVLGRADSAAGAEKLANTAAAVFVDELNKYTEAVGPYALTTVAVEPTRAVDQVSAATSWGLGLFAGLAAGVGTVALILILRRPVVDTASAEDAAGAPVFARMTLVRGRSTTGMGQLCRRILADSVELLLLVGPQNTRRDRFTLTEEIVTWLGRVRRVIPLRTSASMEEFGSASLTARDTPQGPRGTDLLVIDDASPVEVATRPEKSLTLLVVREGTPQRSLREYAEQYLDGDDTAILLIAQPSRWRRPSRGDSKHQAAVPSPSATGGTGAQSDDASLLASRFDGTSTGEPG